MLRCTKCQHPADRWWVMTNFDAGDDGEWERLQPGDFCLPCRRAHRQRFRFKTDIPGIDAFLPHPRPNEPSPPRAKPVCPGGPDCRHREPEHFTDFAHPWLMALP